MGSDGCLRSSDGHVPRRDRRPSGPYRAREAPGSEEEEPGVGVFELAEARETSRPKGGGEDRFGKPIKEYRGWEFLRTSTDAEKPATTSLRKTFMDNTLVAADGQPVRRTENPYYLQGLGRRR